MNHVEKALAYYGNNFNCSQGVFTTYATEMGIDEKLALKLATNFGGGDMKVYHVVTDRPMSVGQKIIFDENNHSGVYQRVMDKLDVVSEMYENPDKYKGENLEHHTSVALRELALEEVRKEEYPFYPSRMSCLYVSRTYEEAVRWGEFFARIGRPTYSIVELDVKGNCFIGDATKCFDGQTDKAANKELAKQYWANPQNEDNPVEVCEILVDGEITVLAILKEINANIKEHDANI